MSIARVVSNTVEWLLRRSRRLDRFYRDAFDRIARDRILAIAQVLVNLPRRNQGLMLAEERLVPGEEKLAEQITAQMSAFLRRTYTNGTALRAGNTKTHGLVRGILEVLPELPPDLAHGLFATPLRYHAWVRFAGPGPYAPADLDDNGVLSMSVKVMGVPGDKLMDDEQLTQDFTGISAPTFTTPDVVENLKLQRWIGAGAPAIYFINPLDPHILDAVMQGLFSRAHASPLELPYHSCVPYGMGGGSAMKYELRPHVPQRSTIPRRPGPDYLRDAMSRTLSERDVCFDLLVQMQTDAHRMPLENSSVIWPQHLSPMRPVARLLIPRQSFTAREQLDFDRHLSFNPWHALPEHRPLGNQNRARRLIYQATSEVRQQMNRDARIEPTGLEQFPQSPALELERVVMR
jgi:hypothetical protein